VVGCLAVLGSRIPVGLRIMLLSLAIVDDIGAILVIAIGYTGNVDWAALATSVAAVAIIIGCMQLGVRNKAIYLFLALWVWHAVHASGIHATIAGVVVGFLTPARARISERRLGLIIDNALHFMRGEGWRAANERYAVLRQMERAARGSIAPLERFETGLHPWVGFAIMPLFALANAGVRFELADLSDPVAVAVVLGLVLGKPIGVLLFGGLAVKTGLTRLPNGVTWGVLTGGGFLAGIGFTMAIFISGLALQGVMLGAAKVGILAGSVVSAAIGMALLVVLLPKTPTENPSATAMAVA
jgi:NhaA family Na+:H+ antiporter